MSEIIIKNSLKQKLKEGKVAIGLTVLEWTRPSISKIAKQAGFDFLFLEYEHTYFNEESMAGIILLGREIDLPVVVKVPSLHRHLISRAFDAGALGVQLPRTETLDDLNKFIRYSKLPPVGDRAGCPGIAHTQYLPVEADEFFHRVNEETLLIAHIETAEGVKNVEAIVDNEQVDAVFVGPYDLAASLGYPGESEHPTVLSEIERIIKLSHDNHKAPGITALDFETGKRWIDRGMQLIESISDIGLVYEGGFRLMNQFKEYTQ